MLNEKKIRLMTRTAIYEKREGKEDLKVNSYCGSDYVRFNMLKTLIGVTIAVFVQLYLCPVFFPGSSSDDFQGGSAGSGKASDYGLRTFTDCVCYYQRYVLPV